MTPARPLAVLRPLRRAIGAAPALRYRRLTLLWRRGRREPIGAKRAPPPIRINHFAAPVHVAISAPVTVLGATVHRTHIAQPGSTRILQATLHRATIRWRSQPGAATPVGQPAAFRPLQAQTVAPPHLRSTRTAPTPSIPRRDAEMRFADAVRPPTHAAPPSRIAAAHPAAAPDPLPLAYQRARAAAPLAFLRQRVAAALPAAPAMGRSAHRPEARQFALPAIGQMVSVLDRGAPPRYRPAQRDFAAPRPSASTARKAPPSRTSVGRTGAPRVWRTAPQQAAVPLSSPAVRTLRPGYDPSVQPPETRATAFGLPVTAPALPDTNRIVDEVMRRLDQRLRNERQRRGI